MQYCHYVAGLVGIGLSQLFSASKLEDPEVGQDTELANSMGLFLQKTNIIRDYLEDTQEGRAFWPQEVRLWCEHVCFSCVSDLRPTLQMLQNTFHCWTHTNLNIYSRFISRMWRFAHLCSMDSCVTHIRQTVSKIVSLTKKNIFKTVFFKN